MASIDPPLLTFFFSVRAHAKTLIFFDRCHFSNILRWPPRWNMPGPAKRKTTKLEEDFGNNIKVSTFYLRGFLVL